MTSLSIGSQYNNDEDCRSTGCTVGECVRQGLEFVCKQGEYSIYILLIHYTHYIKNIYIFLSKIKREKN